MEYAAPVWDPYYGTDQRQLDTCVQGTHMTPGYNTRSNGHSGAGLC